MKCVRKPSEDEVNDYLKLNDDLKLFTRASRMEQWASAIANEFVAMYKDDFPPGSDQTIQHKEFMASRAAHNRIVARLGGIANAAYAAIPKTADSRARLVMMR